MTRLDPDAIRSICEQACGFLDVPGGISRSADAVQQLVFTVGAEVGGRDIRRQIGGPALSWWQIEPATAIDCDSSWLRYRPAVRDAIYRHLSHGMSLVDGLYDDPLVAAMIARVWYRRQPFKSFAWPDDIGGQARIWKEHYNTPLGKGTEREAVERYMAWVGPDYHPLVRAE